jgi:hypothetical protein
MTTTLSYKNPNLFCCELCNYSTSYSKDYKKHTLTKKHINNLNNSLDNQNVLNSKTYKCDICSKIFNDRAGLWRHKKKCNNTTEHTKTEEKEHPNISKVNLNSIDKDELIMIILKQNAQLMEQNNGLMEIVKNGTHNT